MSADGPDDSWTSDVIEFLKAELPIGMRSPLTWSDDGMTAYQNGCDALVALGQADRVAAGALAKEHPRMPDILPRWDDICVTVLRLAHVHADFLQMFTKLGLKTGEQWTPASETIRWRDIDDWKPAHVHDARFIYAVEMACKNMPDDIDEEMDRLVTITEDHVERSLAVSRKVRESNYARAKQRGGKDLPLVVLPPDVELERARVNVEHNRSGELDWLFYRRWRLSDGWLSNDEARRALAIFHDPLAQNMRRAVIRERYDGLVMAELGWRPPQATSAT